MDANRPDKDQQNQPNSNQQEQPDLNRDQNNREQIGNPTDRSTADDRRSGRGRRSNNEEGIPELDEPNVEGVGNESGTDLDLDEDERSGGSESGR